MNRLFLQEVFYCSLHLLKNGTAKTGNDCYVNIARNADGKFLQEDKTFNTDPFDFVMDEKNNGLYQYVLDASDIDEINKPESFTIYYKTTINNIEYNQSEQLYYERKNKAKLV